MKSFDRDGVTFRYPDGWQLESDDAGGGWTVTLSSPQTAFLLISLRPDADDPRQVADEALSALKSEYPQIDADEVVDSLAGQPAVGHDIEFLTLDTSIACWTRCIDTTAGPLLMMGQTSEYDREANEPILAAIRVSLAIED